MKAKCETKGNEIGGTSCMDGLGVCTGGIANPKNWENMQQEAAIFQSNLRLFAEFYLLLKVGYNFRN